LALCWVTRFMGRIFGEKLRILGRTLEPRDWELKLGSAGAAVFPKAIAIFALKICECKPKWHFALLS